MAAVDTILYRETGELLKLTPFKPQTKVKYPLIHFCIRGYNNELN